MSLYHQPGESIETDWHRLCAITDELEWAVRNLFECAQLLAVRMPSGGCIEDMGAEEDPATVERCLGELRGVLRRYTDLRQSSVPPVAADSAQPAQHDGRTMTDD